MRDRSILVICEEYDRPAFWAAERLGRLGWQTDVVTGAALAAAARWEHRVGREGASVSIRLADGRRIGGGAPVPILNRLAFLPSAWVGRIGGPDRDYGLQEMYALYLSWLHAMPGVVINRPSPAGLCGAWRHPSRWALLAGQAGLPVRAYRSSHGDAPEIAGAAVTAPPLTAFIIGDRVVAPGLPGALVAPCRELARRSGSALIGVDFATGDRGWEFAGASAMPDLTLGGNALIEALACSFTVLAESLVGDAA